MSDRVCASIEIGGTLPRSALEALVDVILGEGVGYEYGSCLETKQQVLDYIESRNDLTLFLCANEVPWGEFTELQQFCERHQMHYKLCYDGYFDSWSAGVKIYNPLTGDKTWTADANHRPVFTALELTQFASIKDAIANLRQAEDWSMPFNIT